MREIELTKNKVALVDDDDFEMLSIYTWKAYGNRTIYVQRAERSEDGNWILFSMHNEIWQHHHGPMPEGYTVDHADRDPLNNQKSNLRLATPAQQSQNQSLCRNNTSGYIGVSLHKKTQKYRATISREGKQVYLGLFSDPKEAARARDIAAFQHDGKFAVLNFPRRADSQSTVE